MWQPLQHAYIVYKWVTDAYIAYMYFMCVSCRATSNSMRQLDDAAPAPVSASTAAIIPVPEYQSQATYDAYILCGGMNFRRPHGTPQHTDDIRLRALGHITGQRTRIKTVGFAEDHEPYHMCSNLRVLKAGRRPSAWRADALQCTVFVLDYYWTQRGYFREGMVEGYGGNWFAVGGQVAQMLGSSRDPQARTVAVLLPNDRQGEVMHLYHEGRAAMEKEGVAIALLDEAAARSIHPLVVATLFAERRTTWSQMRPGDHGGVWHRYEEGAGRSTLNLQNPFILCYSTVRTSTIGVNPLEVTRSYLSSLILHDIVC
jgi:hypothetical protein